MTEEEHIEQLDRINRAGASPFPLGDGRNHWVGCENVHPACRAQLHDRP